MIAAALVCLVIGITDGDTITARCGEPGAYEQMKVRIQGIDAPERKQPYGNRARQALSDMVFHTVVRSALQQDGPLPAQVFNS